MVSVAQVVEWHVWDPEFNPLEKKVQVCPCWSQTETTSDVKWLAQVAVDAH
jgi:hypothetical protein